MIERKKVKRKEKSRQKRKKETKRVKKKEQKNNRKKIIILKRQVSKIKHTFLTVSRRKNKRDRERKIMKSISRGTKFPRGTPRKLGGHSWDTRQQDCQVLLATARQQDYHVH